MKQNIQGMKIVPGQASVTEFFPKIVNRFLHINYLFCRKFYHTCFLGSSPVKCQPHKIVKHTQTIRGQHSTSCLSVFGHFVGLVVKGLNILHFELDYKAICRNICEQEF